MCCTFLIRYIFTNLWLLWSNVAKRCLDVDVSFSLCRTSSLPSTLGMFLLEARVKSSDDMLAEVRELNLSYLLLAQRMLRDNHATAQFRLGLSKEVADILQRLTLSQVVSLASANSLLCGFRFDDYTLLSAITRDALGGTVRQAHATMLLAGRPVEQIA